MAVELDQDEERELDELRRKLEKLDFNFAARDPIEQAFLRARFDLTANTIGNPVVTPENKRLAIQVLVKALLEEVRLVER